MTAPRRHSLIKGGPMIGVGVLTAAVMAAAVSHPTYTSTVLTLLIFVLAGGVALVTPRAALPVAIVLGGTNGGLRRFLAYGLESEGPLVRYLVLVPALMVAVSLITMLLGRRFEPGERSRLPGFYVGVLIVLALAAANPGGAGFTSNFLTGALLLAATSAFVLGYRQLVPLKWIIIASVFTGSLNASAILWQEFNGLTPWDAKWVEEDAYASVFITGGAVRALGLTAHVGEAAAFCAISLVLCAFVALRRRNLLYVLPVPLLASGLLITGIRTSFILALVGLTLALAATTRHPRRNFVLSLIIVVPLAQVVALTLLPAVSSVGIERTLRTISGTESADVSTVGIHLDLMIRSVLEGASSVIGTGAGRIGVLSGGEIGGADTDLGNVALMAGVVGLVVCLWGWLWLAKNSGLAMRSTAGAATLLVAVTTFTNWYFPGHYGMMLVVWGTLGLFAAEVSREAQRDKRMVSSG